MKVRIVKNVLLLEPESGQEAKLLVMLDGQTAQMPSREAGASLHIAFPKLGLKKRPDPVPTQP